MLELKQRRRPSDTAVTRFLEQLTRREVTMQLQNALRLLAGLAIISAVLAVLPWLVNKAAHFLDFNTDDHIQLRLWQWLLIDAALLLITLPIAIATHKESRTDTANQYLNSGSMTHAASGEDLLLLIIITIGCLGLLQGEFLLIDALKTIFLRLRLAGIDRHRAAMIVATLAARPAGMKPEELIDPGETPEQFRKTIANLMVFDWVEFSSKEHHLMLLSPARRALRG